MRHGPPLRASGSPRDLRTLDVPVAGGSLRVGVWDAPIGAPTVVLVHGITSSHLAFAFLADRLPGVRIVAPDLRGRGRSLDLEGPAGMAAHADDLAAVFDALDIEHSVVVGHSMGAFVAVVFAARHPDRVDRLVLVDGGLPLDVPVGMPPEQLVSHILGPTADRLSMRFASRAEYRDFWRDHPAFAQAWSPQLEEYLDYDLVPDGHGALRPATSYQVTVEDTVDMNTGTSLPDALGGLQHPTRWLTVDRGLRDQPPGLYAPEYRAATLNRFPHVRHQTLDGFNHYTVVMSAAGADAVAGIVLDELTRAGVPDTGPAA